jgi:hypothetical protein
LGARAQAADSDSDGTTEFGDMNGGGWGDTSDDSDWDQPDCTAAATHVPVGVPSPASPPLSPKPPSPFQWDSLLDSSDTHAESAHTGRAGGAAVAERQQPLQQVSAAWNDALPWVGTDAPSAMVVTEAQLCRAALLALQGVPSAAFLLELDADVFRTSTRLRVRHLSSASLVVRYLHPPLLLPVARASTTPCPVAAKRWFDGNTNTRRAMRPPTTNEPLLTSPPQALLNRVTD